MCVCCVVRPQVWASEEAGWVVLVSGATVRRWAADFLSHREETLDSTDAKRLYTFSPYRVGQHVQWLLANEVLAAKARKWIGQHAEVKGKANMRSNENEPAQ